MTSSNKLHPSTTGAGVSSKSSGGKITPISSSTNDPLAKVVDWVTEIFNSENFISGLNTRIGQIGENTPDARSLKDEIRKFESRIEKLKQAISLEGQVHPNNETFAQQVSDAISRKHSDITPSAEGKLTEMGHAIQATWQSIVNPASSHVEPTVTANDVNQALKDTVRDTFLSDKNAATAAKPKVSSWSFSSLKEEATRRIHSNFSGETNFVVSLLRLSGVTAGLGMTYNGVQNLVAYGSLNNSSFPEDQKPMVNSQKSHLLFMGATNVALGIAIAGASVFMEFPSLKSGGRGGIV